jgi:hypothetical protein
MQKLVPSPRRSQHSAMLQQLRVRFPSTTRRQLHRRGQRSFFGYQAHIVLDQGNDLIRGAIVTAAEVGDRLVAGTLIQGRREGDLCGQGLRQPDAP